MEDVKCTVGELLTWYAGDPNWHEDWQTTDTMGYLVGNKEVHCQDDGENGMSHLRFLKENENELIEVESIDYEDSYYDIYFIVKGKFYSMQSILPALVPLDY